MENDEKACPFCAETIKAAAVVCKHCGRDLPSSAPFTPAAIEPAPASSAKGSRWWVWLIAAPVVVFVGSALLAGVRESNRGSAVRDIASKLPSDIQLMNKISEAVKGNNWSADFSCYTLAAASYKLAAARDAGLSMEEAADATNDPILMRPISESGANPRYTLLGLAKHVYDSKAPPQQAFEDRLSACGKRT